MTDYKQKYKKYKLKYKQYASGKENINDIQNKINILIKEKNIIQFNLRLDLSKEIIDKIDLLIELYNKKIKIKKKKSINPFMKGTKDLNNKIDEELGELVNYINNRTKKIEERCKKKINQIELNINQYPSINDYKQELLKDIIKLKELVKKMNTDNLDKLEIQNDIAILEGNIYTQYDKRIKIIKNIKGIKKKEETIKETIKEKIKKDINEYYELFDTESKDILEKYIFITKFVETPYWNEYMYKQTNRDNAWAGISEFHKKIKTYEELYKKTLELMENKRQLANNNLDIPVHIHADIVDNLKKIKKKNNKLDNWLYVLKYPLKEVLSIIMSKIRYSDKGFINPLYKYSKYQKIYNNNNQFFEFIDLKGNIEIFDMIEDAMESHYNFPNRHMNLYLLSQKLLNRNFQLI